MHLFYAIYGSFIRISSILYENNFRINKTLFHSNKHKQYENNNIIIHKIQPKCIIL